MRIWLTSFQTSRSPLAILRSGPSDPDPKEPCLLTRRVVASISVSVAAWDCMNPDALQTTHRLRSTQGILVGNGLFWNKGLSSGLVQPPFFGHMILWADAYAEWREDWQARVGKQTATSLRGGTRILFEKGCVFAQEHVNLQSAPPLRRNPFHSCRVRVLHPPATHLTGRKKQHQLDKVKGTE